jgi:ribosome-associated protein
MAEPIVVTPGVVVPAAALSLHTSRSSGPGGQNVNKVASKVELRVELDRVEGLPAEARTRLESLADGRLDAEGRLLVVSQRTRDQHRNLEDAREKVRALVRRAMIRPRTRRPTRATAASKARRLDEKKRRSAHKRRRGTVRPDED